MSDTVYVKLIRPATVAGAKHPAGAVLGVNRKLGRHLIVTGLAVPRGDDGRQLTQDTIIQGVTK